MRFLLKNSNIFLLPGNPHMIHLGTITSGLREFIVMYCAHGPKAGQTYIEEAVLHSVDFSKDVYGSCKFIEDDNLAFDLTKFAEEKDLINPERLIGYLIENGKMSWLAPKNDLLI